MNKIIIYIILLFLITNFINSRLFAEIPAAESYIFGNQKCSKFNTDVEKHKSGRKEYLFTDAGERYTNRGCDWAPGWPLSGVAYAYGHNDSPSVFKGKLASGLGAGNHKEHYYRISGGADPAWSTGVDCTGFVCNIWGIGQVPTWNWSAIAYKVPRWDAQILDSLLLKAGHVLLYEAGDIESGNSAFYYEASALKKGVRRGNGNVSGYILYRRGQDKTAPQISDVTISPNPFSLDGDGKDDTSTLSFTVSDTQCGAVSLKLYIKDQLVYTFPNTCRDGAKLPKNGNQYTQKFSWIWDGKINGVLQPKGEYPLKIEVEDLNKNSSSDISHYFSIEKDTKGVGEINMDIEICELNGEWCSNVIIQPHLIENSERLKCVFTILEIENSDVEFDKNGNILWHKEGPYNYHINCSAKIKVDYPGYTYSNKDYFVTKKLVCSEIESDLEIVLDSPWNDSPLEGKTTLGFRTTSKEGTKMRGYIKSIRHYLGHDVVMQDGIVDDFIDFSGIAMSLFFITNSKNRCIAFETQQVNMREMWKNNTPEDIRNIFGNESINSTHFGSGYLDMGERK